MNNKFEKLKLQLEDLIFKGEMLYYAMADDQNKLGENLKEKLHEKNIKLPNFYSEYDLWYSEALRVVEQIIPNRYNDFVKLYKNEKRKEISYETYCISDYLIGLTTSLGGKRIADQTAAIPKMQLQNAILNSTMNRFDSMLFDIKEILQADIYDSELHSASDLSKNGFYRASGVIAGVVLEKHLGHICELHNLKIRKKKPTLSDYYQTLKENEIIDTIQWRYIQHLGDLRNLCSHNKDREPTKDDVTELIEGVGKIIKTIF